jgi:hypothetical protein
MGGRGKRKKLLRFVRNDSSCICSHQSFTMVLNQSHNPFIAKLKIEFALVKQKR